MNTALSKRAVLLAAAALFLWQPVWADMIEVRGKGIVSGKVLSEDTDRVVFKDSWGNTETYERKDVLLLERTRETAPPPRPEIRREPAPVRVPQFDVPSLETASFDAAAQAEDSGWLARTNRVIDGLCQMALDYAMGDSERAAATIQSASAVVSGPKAYGTGNFVFGFLGMAMMGIGALAAIGFGILLLLKFFEDSFLWGIIFLSNGMGQFAPMIGGAIGLVMLIPGALTLYFIVTRWPVTRKPVTLQIFSVNFAILGFWILKIVS